VAIVFVPATPLVAQAAAGRSVQALCGPVAPGYARCLGLQVVSGPRARPFTATGTAGGYSPADLQSAYNLPSAAAGSGQTVAIVDAHDDPNAELDLGTYRAQFGIAPCTTANGCFRKVNQTGGFSYPSPDAGWASEISLDLDMASAICPNCHILLLEAASESISDLGTAVNEAATPGLGTTW
jgi:subtilase family serine protease